jgi:tripartite-type tricarboxylate transporter receptor subunit TctC
MKFFRALAGTALAMLAAAAVAAWPEKPVHYIIPFSPGGESDIAARFQQLKFKQKFGQEMVVESKPGAGGALAWAQLNALPGDGYSIMGINLPHIVLQPLEGNVQYRTDELQSVYWFHFTPDALQKQISDAFDAINNDPEFRRQMVDGGFEPVNIGVEKIPAFLAARKKDYEDIARQMGLLK